MTRVGSQRHKKKKKKYMRIYIYIYIYIYVCVCVCVYSAVLKRLTTPSDFHIPLPSIVPFVHS